MGSPHTSLPAVKVPGLGLWRGRLGPRSWSPARLGQPGSPHPCDPISRAELACFLQAGRSQENHRAGPEPSLLNTSPPLRGQGSLLGKPECQLSLSSFPGKHEDAGRALLHSQTTGIVITLGTRRCSHRETSRAMGHRIQPGSGEKKPGAGLDPTPGLVVGPLPSGSFRDSDTAAPTQDLRGP